MNISSEKIDIRSEDGISSQITVFRTHNTDAAVIICMPAMGAAAKHYSSLAETLAGFGWNVIIADLRGNGESLITASHRTDFGYHEMVAYDWPAIVNTSSNLFPNSNKILLGHSLGGQLSALYMSQWPDIISALILVAAPSVYYRGWPFRYGLGLILLTQIARLVSGMIGYFPAQRLGFGRRVGDNQCTASFSGCRGRAINLCIKVKINAVAQKVFYFLFYKINISIVSAVCSYPCPSV